MLKHTKAISGFSVNDLQQAKAFYHDVLGLTVNERPMVWELLIEGGHTIIMYPKEDHVPATYTILNFLVPKIEETVTQLTEKGVRFLQYGPPIQTDEKGIFRGGGPLIAWFTDPSGNILSIIEEPT
jgi:predicted enzyme related to lactoylglutathione lyase